MVGGTGAHGGGRRRAASAPGTGATGARAHRSYQSDSWAAGVTQSAGEVRRRAAVAALVDWSCAGTCAVCACRDRARERAVVAGQEANGHDRGRATSSDGRWQRTAGGAAGAATRDRDEQRLGVGEGALRLAALSQPA